MPSDLDNTRLIALFAELIVLTQDKDGNIGETIF
jgi:hypothetical protein